METNKRENIDGYNDLEFLALDFIWGWSQNHASSKIWEQLDPVLWELLRNPWTLLQTISVHKLEKFLSDPSFRKKLTDLIQNNAKEAKEDKWFQKVHPKTPLSCVAYFSMEYMLSEALPIYSGGLGNVAGDQLKAASDLNVPVIGIGMLYQRGYFRQVFDKEGVQHAVYPFNDPGQLPIRPLRKADGEWLKIHINFPGMSIWLRTWEVIIGKVKLYLLDSNDAVNYPALRGITSELYGGDSDLRIKQEIILGIGGWRLLKELDIEPEVCHLNEGHAAFAVLERAKCLMDKLDLDFETALTATRAGNLFTTHTAVPAGFDRFQPALVKQYFETYAGEKLGISFNSFLALGRQNPNDQEEPFNMAYLAIRGSGAINGVSRLHGEVSRQILDPLFPRWPRDQIPIGHITNGVHMPSWSSVQAGELWNAACKGKIHWNGFDKPNISEISDAELWRMRNESRKIMIHFARNRFARIWEARGFAPEEIARAKLLFNENILTLGFARRFATYKRPNMLLHDTDRLIRILLNPKRPVQLIISGKAHPADKPGQALIKEWIQLFDKRPEVRNHLIFLSDYDMRVTDTIVQGVDLWINTPRRPWEACGTSGMKVLSNGGINLSELDGWWAEAYTPEVGWAIGDGVERGDNPEWDAKEANDLYDLLEQEIVPIFYTRNEEGLPSEWLKKVKNSMTILTPAFSADRAVRDYTEKYYLPAAENYYKRIEHEATLAKKITSWQRDINNKWNHLRFEDVKITEKGDSYEFNVYVFLNAIDPQHVKVELFSHSLVREMTLVNQTDAHTYHYVASVPATIPAMGYTPRIIPYLPESKVPLESPHILWRS